MKTLLKVSSRPPLLDWKLVAVVSAVLMVAATNVHGAAKFVNGLVPDWNQPYRYIPGGDPNGIPISQWNDWCAPCSGANLAGHWTDARGIPVADTTNFPNTSVAWAAGPSWQDYLADGTVNRPPGPPGLFPAQTTDIGWYMDTNLGIPYDIPAVGVMGGYPLGHLAQQAGTFLKDIQPGLQNYLNSRYSFSGSVFWRTGTRGSGFASGTDPTGAAAVTHPNGASAFAEVTSEINTNRTLILCFTHWSIKDSGINLLPTGTNTESAYGGRYYTWNTSPPQTNVEKEVWNSDDSGNGQGHAVTVVGYIRAGDQDDQGPILQIGPNDWVIVHDNWSTTPRNVIIPFKYNNGTWVANTTAVPWPTGTKFVKGLVPDWNQPYQYTGQSPNKGPGPDPNNQTPFSPVDQWNDWCAPCSAANLVGHWTDCHCAPVADTTPFDGSTVAWGADPSWQDYLADGFARSAPQGAPGPLPASPTDIGWYMDTNLGIPYDIPAVGVMGGFFFGNGLHAGTFLKDIHVGVQKYLNCRYTNTLSGAGWITGTEGRGFAAGMDPTGGMAQVLGDPVSAFNEVKFEIDRNHTLILCFKHWNVAAAATVGLSTFATNQESGFGGSYYTWSYTPSPGSPNAEDEAWNGTYNETNLGHAVTAVGYIPANDVLDPAPPTDWVIVHDNWASTPRNVIIPFDFANNWVANVIAYPDPYFLMLTGIQWADTTNAVVNFMGIPGCRHGLQWKNDLRTNMWSTVVSNVTFAPGAMQTTNAVGTNVLQRFYRIQALY